MFRRYLPPAQQLLLAQTRLAWQGPSDRLQCAELKATEITECFYDLHQPSYPTRITTSETLPTSYRPHDCSGLARTNSDSFFRQPRPHIFHGHCVQFADPTMVSMPARLNQCWSLLTAQAFCNRPKLGEVLEEIRRR